jgi:hypothetical protein
MKGIVFTEFMEMVEEKFGDEMVDKLIEENGGVSNVMLYFSRYMAVSTPDYFFQMEQV